MSYYYVSFSYLNVNNTEMKTTQPHHLQLRIGDVGGYKFHELGKALI